MNLGLIRSGKNPSNSSFTPSTSKSQVKMKEVQEKLLDVQVENDVICFEICAVHSAIRITSLLS